MAIVMSPAMMQMDKIIDKLYSRHDAAPFREPVNWRELGLFDYPELIKRPMALSDVKAKLTAGQYRNPVECADDVNLIWQNWWVIIPECFTLPGVGSHPMCFHTSMCFHAQHDLQHGRFGIL